VLYSFCPLLLYSFFYSSSFSPRHHQQHAMISTWTTPQPRLHHLCFHLSTILHYIRYHDNLPFSNRQITTKKNYIQSSSPSPHHHHHYYYSYSIMDFFQIISLLVKGYKSNPRRHAIYKCKIFYHHNQHQNPQVFHC